MSGEVVEMLVCAVCGWPTDMVCSDCRIDGVSSAEARVCTRTECRDRHEAEACTVIKGADGRAMPRRAAQ